MGYSVSEQLVAVQERIEAAAVRVGRKGREITLVAVTKTVPWETVQPWYAAGQMDFGENRVQEALAKFIDGQAKKMVARFHLIGPLQSNKAKKAVQFFDVIQSLDRLDVLADVQRHARDAGKIIEGLVEVKLSQEPAKAGLAPDVLDEFLDKARQFPNVIIKGLMGIPPAAATGDKARPYFARLRTLFEKTKLPILSMGMSSDFETAIEEGSTLVRLGTALFGKR